MDISNSASRAGQRNFGIPGKFALQQTSRSGMITQLANLVLTVIFVAFMVVVGQRHIESNTTKVAKAAPTALALPAL